MNETRKPDCVIVFFSPSSITPISEMNFHSVRYRINPIPITTASCCWKTQRKCIVTNSRWTNLIFVCVSKWLGFFTPNPFFCFILLQSLIVKVMANCNNNNLLDGHIYCHVFRSVPLKPDVCWQCLKGSTFSKHALSSRQKKCRLQIKEFVSACPCGFTVNLEA